MIFRQIEFGSEEYEMECALRDQVLRMPLGLSLRDEDLSGEAGQLHFGLFDSGGNLLACVIAVPVDSAEVKIRQMAVTPSRQGMGLGREIMTGLHSHLHALGFTRCVLNARSSAFGFYRKLGYTAVGDGFVEIGIPHMRMERALQSPHAMNVRHLERDV